MAEMSTDAPSIISPAFEKAATQATQALALMYKEVHKTEPDSPMAQALMQLQSAIAEIEGNAGMGGPAAPMEGEAPMEPGMEAAPMEAPVEDVPPPPEAPSTDDTNPFMAAAGGLKDDMLTAAKRRSA
jgi:hypothetical protein